MKKPKTFRPHKVKSTGSLGSVSKIRRTKEQVYGTRSDWEALRLSIFRRDNYTCVKCKCPVSCSGSPHTHARVAHCDHIIIAAQGGQTVPSNLRTLCDLCHSKLPRHHQHKKFILCNSK
jgi:5-methylcytosine-specific restriction endonuclease McrA